MKGKNIFITGASSGIGRAVASRFAARGANLVICARRQDRLKDLAEQLTSQYSVDVEIFCVDLSDYTQVEHCFSQLASRWKKIDVLINNAGMALGMDKLQDGSPSDWDAMIDVNVKGLLYITRQIIPHMIEQGSGHVINVGSISARRTYAGGSVYCATKFAVRGLTDGLAMDVHGTSIRVGCVHPGMVSTEFSATRFSGDVERADDVYKGMVPLDADDVADAIEYMATRPAHVNIPDMQIFPADQTAAGLVFRREQQEC